MVRRTVLIAHNLHIIVVATSLAVIDIERVLFIEAAQALFDIIAGKERDNEIDLLLELFLSGLFLAFPGSDFLQSALLLPSLFLLGFDLFQTPLIILLP